MDKMLPQGLGYWTPLLGAAPGAQVTVALKLRGKNLATTSTSPPPTNQEHLAPDP